MRKVLLGTTALVAASMVAAGTASAAEKIEARLGGYMEQWVGYSDQDDVAGAGDLSGIATNSDTEIFFLGKTELDNGIGIGFNVQLEGNTSGDQIDESYMIIDGSFGEINIGNENSAQYKMQYTAPDVGIGVNSGDTTAWASYAGIGGSAGAFRGAFGSTGVEADRMNDVFRITYYTPRFSGFQVGASYIPTPIEDGGGFIDRDASGSIHDGFAFGANFVQDFDGVGIAVSGGYGWVSAEEPGCPDDPTALNFGANVSFAGFTIGGSYAQTEDNCTASGGDMDGWDIGASYGVGPWAVSVTWFHGERDGSGAALEAEQDILHFSGRYTLGPGVAFKGTIGIADIADESGLGEDNDALYVVVGPTISF